MEKNAQRGAKAAHLLPFAPAILELAEERRQVKKVDSQNAAAVIDKLGQEIEDLTSSLEARLKSRAADDAELSADNLKMAAETVRELRSNLRGWFRFYDGYDPMFSWWMRAPYQKTDAALEKYVALLNEPPAAEATAATQASFQTQENDAAKTPAVNKSTSANTAEVDVPDLTALIAEPPTQMEAIIAKFRSDFPGLRGWGGGRGGRRGGGRESAGGDFRDGGDDQGARRLAARDRYEDDDDDEDQQADRDDANRERTARSGDRRRGRQNTPEARERQKRRLTEWATALDGLNFDSFSQADRVDYLMLKNHIQYRLKRLEMASASDDDERPAALDASGIAGRPIGREALLVELRNEMIPYTPEELLEIAVRENAWCEAELLKASQRDGLRRRLAEGRGKSQDDARAAGRAAVLIRDLAWEAINYLREHDLVTVPPLAAETWGMQMMSPRRQLINPFFTGGNEISVSFPTDTMTHDPKLQSMRGNNIPFARATVHHELIPGHNLQFFMTSRYKPLSPAVLDAVLGRRLGPVLGDGAVRSRLPENAGGSRRLPRAGASTAARESSSR